MNPSRIKKRWELEFVVQISSFKIILDNLPVGSIYLIDSNKTKICKKTDIYI